MKKCPFCAEKIQEEAIKCRYCNEILIELTQYMPKEQALPSQEGRDSKLVAIQVLADILGVPKSWIYDKTRLGPEAIPYVKVGKYLRFDPQEVIQFFEAKAAAR